MPAIAFYGCKCTGHDVYPPRPNDQASPNVFVNNLGVHRQGDHWAHHCSRSCHDSVLSGGSSTVFVNGKPIGRIGDGVACGSLVAEGSSNSFSG